MHVTVYLAIMLVLSTIIAALSLLLMVLERRPQSRHTAAGRSLGLNQLSPGTRARDRTRLAVQWAIRNRRGEARRGLGARRAIILGGLPRNDADAEDEGDQEREAFQDWELPAPTTAPGRSPSPATNNQTHG